MTVTALPYIGNFCVNYAADLLAYFAGISPYPNVLLLDVPIVITVFVNYNFALLYDVLNEYIEVNALKFSIYIKFIPNSF